MKDSQTRHLEMFQRVHSFKEINAGSFPPNFLGSQLFAEIKNASDALETHAATQFDGAHMLS